MKSGFRALYIRKGWASMLKENEYKEILSDYVNEEMDKLVPERMPGFDHKYSWWYKSKLQKILRSEKSFGSHLKVGYMARRVAIFAVLAMSVFTAGKVSANVFGVNTWKSVVEFFADNEVNHKVYTELNSDTPTEIKSVVRDIPSYVPEGYELESVEDGKNKLEATWQDKCTSNMISYSKNKIIPDRVIIEDAAYDSVTEVSIEGYLGYCYKADDRVWVQWDDMTYSHRIAISDVTVSNDVLLNMADSLYE